MTQDTYDQASKCLANIKKYDKRIGDLNAIKSMLIADPSSLHVYVSTSLSVPVPKGIAVDVVDTVLKRYTNLKNNAQADFDSL